MFVNVYSRGIKYSKWEYSPYLRAVSHLDFREMEISVETEATLGAQATLHLNTPSVGPHMEGASGHQNAHVCIN